jgi:hypothetical protein
MTTSAALAELKELARLVPEADYFRRSPRRLGGAGPHKEWQHFIVHAEGLHLLVNFNVLDDSSPATSETGRLICLARTRAGWVGGVAAAQAGELSVTAGAVNARFGRSSMSFDGLKYSIQATLDRPRIELDLEFLPKSVLALCPNQPLSDNESLSWLFMPRLDASGEVRIEGEHFVLSAAPAYHDHNWGVFRWGDDFSWEWSSVLPASADSPWSAVYMRLLDRARTRARCQGLYIWHGTKHCKIFRDHEIEISMSGHFDSRSCLKIPPVMSLLAPGAANDVPGRMLIRARDRDDQVTLAFELRDLCQVVVPDERDSLAVVVLNEAIGDTLLTGVIGDKALELEGPGVFEFIR